MIINKVETDCAMVSGTFFYADSNWFGMDLKIGKSVDSIKTLIATNPTIESQLTELNNLLAYNGNYFRIGFSEGYIEDFNNIMVSRNDEYIYVGEEVIIEIQHENSDSTVNHVVYSVDDNESYEEAKTYIKTLARQFEEFVKTLNEFVIVTMIR